MKLVLWLAISMISSSVSADHFKPEWTASCAYNGSNFELIFKSTSGDATNDDMQISIKTTEKVVKTLKLPEALYTTIGLTSSLENVCTNRLVAFPMGDAKILFLLSKNMRPGPNEAVLALIDIKSGILLDVLDSKMAIKNSCDTEQFVIKMKDGNHHVRLVTEQMENTGHDASSNYIESWVEIKVVSDKISLEH